MIATRIFGERPTSLGVWHPLVVSCAVLLAGCSVFDALFAAHNNGGTNQLWHVTGAGFEGAPAFDGTTAYFQNANHQVIAIDGKTAVTRWTASTGGFGANTYGYAGCVMATAIVVCGDDDLVGFSPGSGAVVWRYHATTGYSPGYFSPITVGSTIFAGSPSSTIYAINAADGTSRWVVQPFPADTELISIFDPSADGDIVVAGFAKFLNPKPTVGGVIALDAATGKVRWISYFPQAADTTIGTNAKSTALWQNLVLAPSNAAGVIYALDRSTGAITWSIPGVGSRPAAWGGTPVTQDIRAISVAGNTLFAGSLSDWLVAYNLVDRSELWRTASAEGSLNTERIVSDATGVYTVLLSGELLTFSSTGPTVRWITSDGLDFFFGTAAVGTDRIFASRTDGFYAFAK